MGLGSFPSRIPGLVALSNPRPNASERKAPPQSLAPDGAGTAAPPQARKCEMDRAPAGPAAATCYPDSRGLGTRCTDSGGRPGAPASPRSPAPASRSRSDRRPCPLRRAWAGCTAASLLLLRLLSPPPPRPRAAPRGPGTSKPPRRRLPRPPAPLPPRQPPRRKGRRSRAPTTALQRLGAGASRGTPGTPGHQLCLLGKGA